MKTNTVLPKATTRHDHNVPSLPEIQIALRSYAPRLIAVERDVSAAVSLVLRDKGMGPELLFIKRAEHPDDPWSGQLGLPGGRLERGDSSLQQAAEREIREELGVRLRSQDYIARLNDYQSRPQRSVAMVTVASFVYQLEQTPELMLNHEVADAFWAPLHVLVNPANQTTHSLSEHPQAEWPAIAIKTKGTNHVLWGLTYRIVNNLLKIAYT